MQPNDRLQSLDVFRGLTVAGMILVNNPGTWAAIYPPLQHAEWHGCTPTDLVFPFFLFIVGVSISLAFAKRVPQGGGRRDLVRKILKRSLIIFLLGTMMVVYPFYDVFERLGTMRVMGVLQRIGLCYGCASLIYVFVGVRTRYFVAAGLLVLYWLLMRYVPVPGFGAGDLSPQGNLAAYLDRLILGAHTWKKDFDPEGLLSTIPAVVTTLIGVFTGDLIRTGKSPREILKGMLLPGLGLIALGLAWSRWFPLNKSLWTSSYVLYTGGLALVFLSACYWLIDVKLYRKWGFPFLVYGMNALAVFVLSGLLAKTMIRIKFPTPDGKTIHLQALIYKTLFAPLASPVNASLLYALTYVLLWFGAMYLLFRKKIFIKV